MRFVEFSVGRVLFVLTLVSFSLCPRLTLAQAGLGDDRVMLQGFYWESCRHGNANFPQFGKRDWYRIVKLEGTAIRDGRFDLIWLPPPCFAGGSSTDPSAGYGPKQYFNFSNAYGTSDEQRAMLVELLSDGVEPMADIVINHRDGTTTWTDFTKPVWGLWSICSDDECFSNPQSPVYNAPMSERGAPEETPAYRPEGDYAYPSFRDLDHTNPGVRRDIIRYLLGLQSLGYRGWRYDMVHGYNAKWIAVYNRATQPTFSVGEYDWDKEGEQRGWVYATATDSGPGGNDHLKSCSSVFDFTARGSLLSSKGNGHYDGLYGFGNGIGLMGDTTDGLAWCNRAVTFVENHDTGFRTNPDGSPEEGHANDGFANGWEVEQAYAYILTHPGVPCVYWKHYFDWGDDLQNKIKALINARKVAGVNAGSKIHPQDNARNNGVYAAMVEGTHGSLYVRVGGDDNSWDPSMSGYSNFRDYAHGTGWKVWVAIPGNPDVVQAPTKKALPIPAVRDPENIPVADSILQ